MPKKRHIKSFKPTSLTAFPTAASTSNIAADRPQKSVNELLANLRRTSINPSSAAATQSSLPAAAPSVPPAIREFLQIPETPAPRPRRAVRQRFDDSGRRLPAGPPPPRSWVSRGLDESGHGASSSSSRLNLKVPAHTVLPGTYLPERGSLIDTVLQKLAYDWAFHRVYNQYHLYFVPNHLKAALIRYVGIASEEGLSLSDLRAILLPPPATFDEDELESLSIALGEVNYLDLSCSTGRSLKLKEVGELLFPSKTEASKEPQDSWDGPEEAPSPSRALLPNLTHLSLALDPRHASSVSWKQLLALSSNLSSLTHLSLAYWPDPCLITRGQTTTVASPRGNIPYGGTNIYSHSIDHDWSEALLVLRLLSRNLYALEFLDLTGCSPWFKALMAESEHDFIDWSSNWGKITELRLRTGSKPGDDAPSSEWVSYREAIDMARNVEKHIRAMRAGQGRFIVVERDRLEP